MSTSSPISGASPPVARRTIIETRPGSASGHRKRRRSPAHQLRIRPAAIRGAAGLVAASLLLVVLGAKSFAADPSRAGEPGPDEADLVHYADCSRAAMTRPAGFDEAAFCARAFLRIKLSFVPGVSLHDFDALAPREKAAVNLLGYERYVDWRSQHLAFVGVLGAESPPSRASAPN